MPASSIQLSPSGVLDLAKETLFLMKCDWDGCPSILNSWRTLRQHQHDHCHGKPQYECRIKKCSARFHNSKKDICNHIDNSHLSRVIIPCPIKGCPETFGRHNYLASHFQHSHSDLPATIFTDLLKPSSKLFAPSLSKRLPPLPRHPVPIYLHPPLCIRPSPHNWVDQTTRKLSEDDTEDIEFDDLPSVDYGDELLEDLIIRPRVIEPLLQLASPQSMVTVPPRLGKPIPQTIGYDVFALKIDDMMSKGLLADSASRSSESGMDVP